MADTDTAPDTTTETPAGEAATQENSGSIADIFDAVSAAQQTDTVDSEGSEAAPETETKPPEPLLAGKYATPQELEKAHLELQEALGRQGRELGELRKLKEQPPSPDAAGESKDLPDLAPDELEQLRDELIEEHGEKAGAKLYQGFVQKLEAQRLNKAIDERVKPIREAVEPVLKKQDELTQKETELSRKQYVEDTRKEFGTAYEPLQKQLLDTAFMEKVLAKSPLQDAIIQTAKTSPEKAHRMILWEIQNHNLRAESEKKRRSTPADVRSGQSSPRTKLRTGDIRDCFETAEKEFPR